MPNSDPPPANDPTLTEDALRRLEERLDRASEAAERLIAEAAAAASGVRGAAPTGGDDPPGSPPTPGEDTPKPPPAGWQNPHKEQRSPESELELLTQVLQSVRDLVPPELQRRLAEALRELLLALRALIDFYLERLERRRSEPTEVEDIPIS